MQYDSLEDAADHLDDPRYGSGDVEVWYRRERQGRGVPPPRDRSALEESHVRIGNLDADDPFAAFRMMQGVTWSLRGEARPLIRTMNTDHTSMSAGDVVVVDDILWEVCPVGFERVDPSGWLGDVEEALDDVFGVRCPFDSYGATRTFGAAGPLFDRWMIRPAHRLYERVDSTRILRYTAFAGGSESLDFTRFSLGDPLDDARRAAEVVREIEGSC